MILKEAFRELERQYPTGRIKGFYLDRKNKNYAGRVVGYKWFIKNQKGEERMFLVTFRPKGVTGYIHKNYGPSTGMNVSELNYQFKYKNDRLVLFLRDDGSLLPYIFPNVKLKGFLVQNEPDWKDKFFDDNVPDEDERLYNFPVTLATNFKSWYEGKEEI